MTAALTLFIVAALASFAIGFFAGFSEGHLTAMHDVSEMLASHKHARDEAFKGGLK